MPIKNSLTAFAWLAAMLIAAVVGPVPLFAASVGINFVGETSGGTFIVPADSAGVDPQQNWNNIPGQAPGTLLVVPNLTKDTGGVGSLSGVKMTVQYNAASAGVSGVVTNEGAPLNTANRQLMQSYADVLGPVTGVPGTTHVTFENLAGLGPFDLLIYNAGTIPPFQPDRVARYSFYNGTTSVDPLLSTRLIRNKFNPFNVPNDAFKESLGNGTVAGTVEGNYIRISNLNPSSGSLHILAEALTGSPQRGALNGIQLVPATVPEPNTIALLVMASIAGMTLFRRR
ncbi:MAG: PEP-CTERM sorting domain-containing protein [Planctomycetota bacterium]|nr:PEP-CTERM sorting domain-containing protein [Planctomycetota bacterium]